MRAPNILRIFAAQIWSSRHQTPASRDLMILNNHQSPSMTYFKAAKSQDEAWVFLKPQSWVKHSQWHIERAWVGCNQNQVRIHGFQFHFVGKAVGGSEQAMAQDLRPGRKKAMVLEAWVNSAKINFKMKISIVSTVRTPSCAPCASPPPRTVARCRPRNTRTCPHCRNRCSGDCLGCWECTMIIAFWWLFLWNSQAKIQQGFIPRGKREPGKLSFPDLGLLFQFEGG